VSAIGIAAEGTATSAVVPWVRRVRGSVVAVTGVSVARVSASRGWKSVSAASARGNGSPASSRLATTTASSASALLLVAATGFATVSRRVDRGGFLGNTRGAVQGVGVVAVALHASPIVVFGFGVIATRRVFRDGHVVPERPGRGRPQGRTFAKKVSLDVRRRGHARRTRVDAREPVRDRGISITRRLKKRGTSFRLRNREIEKRGERQRVDRWTVGRISVSPARERNVRDSVNV
jgi:hypothetical protein